MQQVFQGFTSSAWRMDIFDGLLSFAATILVIACLNFVNLATARSAARGLDVGTRKALGATFGQIARQDLVQTGLVVTAAIALALIALVPIARAFSGSYALALAVPWEEPRLWIFLAALLIGVTLAAGLYPAVLLARVRPAAALSGAVARSAPRAVRTLLVALQFGTASLLAILVVVLAQQGDAIRDAALGRFHDQYLSLFVANGMDPGAVATEIAHSPRVRGVARVNSPPFVNTSPPRSEYARSADALAPRSTLQQMYVGYRFFWLLEVPLLAGRVFSEDRADDALPRDRAEFAARQGKPIALVLDRDAARTLGWASPGDAIGQILYSPGQPSSQYEVIGVVERVTLNVRDAGFGGVAYFLGANFANAVLVRFDKNDTAAVLADVDGALAKFGPSQPTSKLFLDQLFENAYWTFRLTNRVLAGLAILAIAVAGIGLFGLASYVTSTRTREIGLRKTQGASPTQIVRLLLWDFSKPVIVANVVAWPIAYYAAERYIAVFSEHVTLTPLPFAAALVATLLLACATVTVQAARASRLRPVDALRHD
jgi:putative ABC transport system permease protein